MANETVEYSSCSNQKQEDEECCENFPPASVSGLTGPATPTSRCKDKAKPRLSGLQSALTPILKYLNIGNKRPSPLPILSFDNGPAKPESASTLSLGEKDDNACSMQNENLVEITLLDETCDSPTNITRNTPVITKEWTKPRPGLNVNLHSKQCLTPIHWLQDEILPEMTLLDDTCDSTLLLTRHGLCSNSPHDTPICKTDTLQKHAEKNMEICSKPKESLTLTPKPDTSYVVSENETPTMETSDDFLSKKRPLETSDILSAKTAKLDVSQCSLDKMSTTFTGNLTHSISSGSGVSDSIVEDGKKAQLQATQDISMSSTLESSKSSSENDTQKTDKHQPSAGTHPVNITCDLSKSNTSVQCEECQSSKNVTSELQVEPVKASPEDEPRFIPGGNQNKALSSTFSTVQGSTDVAAQASVLQNRTLDLPTSNSCSSFTSKNENPNVSTEQVNPESSLVLNDNCSGSKLNQNCAMQNQTFEKDSLQVGARIASLQNTFENKLNGTITCTETIARGDKQQVTFLTSSLSPVKNVSTAEPDSPKTLEANAHAASDFYAKPVEPRDTTFNANTPVEENAGSLGSKAGSGEAKDSLNNDPPLGDSSSESHIFSLDNTLDSKPDPLHASTPMPTIKTFNFTVERNGKTTAAQKVLYGEGSKKTAVLMFDRKTFIPHPATKPNILPIKPPSLLSKFKPGSLLPKRHDIPTSGHPMKTNTVHILQQTTEMTSSYNLRSTTAAASVLKPVSGLRKPAVSSIPSANQRAGHSLKPPRAKSTVGGINPVAKTTLPAKRHNLPRTDAFAASKKKKIDTSLPSNNVEDSAALSDTAKAKSLKPPSHSKRTLPDKPSKHDAAIPSSNATASCDPTSKVSTLRSPATSLKAPITRPPCHASPTRCATCSSLEEQLQLKDEEIRLYKKGCATCCSLEEQLKLKDDEIKQLKEELLKWSKTEDPAS